LGAEKLYQRVEHFRVKLGSQFLFIYRHHTVGHFNLGYGNAQIQPRRFGGDSVADIYLMFQGACLFFDDIDQNR
jgi:hypothetical protein